MLFKIDPQQMVCAKDAAVLCCQRLVYNSHNEQNWNKIKRDLHYCRNVWHVPRLEKRGRLTCLRTAEEVNNESY